MIPLFSLYYYVTMFLGTSFFVPAVTCLVVPGRTLARRCSRPSAVQRLYSSSAKNPKSIDGPKTTTQSIQIPQWVPDEDFRTPINDSGDNNDNGSSASGYERPVIQWYPGHIAKAERLLKETFQAVDVVVEVRDARAPKATSHPKVPEWCSGRPRLVVFTHTDMVPTMSHRAWKDYHEEMTAGSESSTQEDDDNNNNNKHKKEQYLWVNAKHGSGIPALHRAIFKAGSHVQERRQRRGLKDRPLRVGLMGYPNVGYVYVCGG